MEKKAISTISSDVKLRPPIVAVLGHVDHGKTTLLDYIRKSHLTTKEYGGITQKIGAYQIEQNGRPITFIDTPGHEAFEKIRARGAQVADIALLIVAANDSVKPQTVEAIKHIKAANIPVIVAINKIDLPDLNLQKVKKDLSDNGIVVEEFGGKVASVAISAVNGKGIDDLLESILLVAELKKISADPQGVFIGVVIESVKDKRKGNTATIIVKNGTLKTNSEIKVLNIIKDQAIVETVKIRAMFDENGASVREAFPGKPVEVLGFKNLPLVGSLVSTDEKMLKTDEEKNAVSQKEGQTEKILKVMIKADSFGSLEAVIDGLPKEVEILEAEVGEITENDIAFAKVSKAVILGFNLKVSSAISKLAEDERVKIRTYNIIYKLFDEVEDVIGYMKTGPELQILGKAKILQEFATSEGKVAGCQITDGRMVKSDKAQLVRGGKVVYEGRIKEIREKKEEVNKVEKGRMCGIRLVPPVDFFIGDVIQSYSIL